MSRQFRTWWFAGLGLTLLLSACDSEPPPSQNGGSEEADTADAAVEEPDDGPAGEVAAFELLSLDAGDEVLAQVSDGEWDGTVPEVPEDDELTLRIRVVDSDGEEVDLEDADNEVQIELAEDANDGIVAFSSQDDQIELFGDAEGITNLVFRWVHQDEVAYETPPVRVIVDHFAGDYVAGREVLDPQPRLLFADGEQATATVYDLITEELITTFELEQPDPVVTASRRSGQIAALTQPGADVVHLIDVGTWALGHGDHGHYYIDDPAQLDALELDGPALPRHGPDRIGVFATGSGEAVVVDELATLQAREARTSVVELGPSDGGGIVPLPRGFVAAAWPEGGQDGGAVDALALLEGDEVVETHPCPEFASMTPTADGVAVACDGLILIGSLDEDDWSVTEVELPDEVGSLAEITGDLFQPVVAASDGSNLVIIDTDAGSLVETIELPSDAVSAPHIDDDGVLLIVTDDGVVHQFDTTSGQLVASSQDTVAFETGEGTPRPHVVGGRDRAYVSSPVDGRILEFATNDDLRLARTFDVGGVPAGLAYFGAMW